jgi:hypothetical protein
VAEGVMTKDQVEVEVLGHAKGTRGVRNHMGGRGKVAGRV